MNQEILASPLYTTLIFLAVLWQIPWKGVALWKSARNKQLGWFIAIFFLNTLAILDIIYLVFFQKEKA